MERKNNSIGEIVTAIIIAHILIKCGPAILGFLSIPFAMMAPMFQENPLLLFVIIGTALYSLWKTYKIGIILHALWKTRKK